jgi:hypothetical protein
LKKDEKTGKWIDIGDKRAAEKTSQALREKTIDEKDENPVKTPFTSPTLVLPTPGEEVKVANTDGDVKKEGNGEEIKDAKKEENGDGKYDVKKETEKGEKEGKSEDSKSKEKDDAMEVDGSDKKTGKDKSATKEVVTVEV